MKKVTAIILIILSFCVGFGTHKIIGMGTQNTNASTPSPSGRAGLGLKVTGIGGIFFKCKDTKTMKEWYKTHLGLNTNEYGASFEWLQADDSTKKGSTEWSPFSDKTKYFEPSKKEFMINYRVDNLELLIAELKKEGVTILDEMEVFDYGKFIHILDIEGNKIELWEPM